MAIYHKFLPEKMAKIVRIGELQCALNKQPLTFWSSFDFSVSVITTVGNRFTVEWGYIDNVNVIFSVVNYQLHLLINSINDPLNRLTVVTTFYFQFHNFDLTLIRMGIYSPKDVFGKAILYDLCFVWGSSLHSCHRI